MSYKSPLTCAYCRRPHHGLSSSPCLGCGAVDYVGNQEFYCPYVTMYADKPKGPKLGDTYFDPNTYTNRTWDGRQWVMLATF